MFYDTAPVKYPPERKTVSGINREFAVTTDQSCLNRWITEVERDEKALNQRRLDLLQRDPAAHYTPHRLIAIDNTLIDLPCTKDANTGVGL